MRMIDELKPLFLYSANKKIYAPIDEKDRRKGSAILLLTPDLDTSMDLMKLNYIHNPNLFTSFYIDRNVMAYINNNKDAIDFDEVEEEKISESMMNLGWTSKIKFKFEDGVSTMDRNYIEKEYNYKNASQICKLIGIRKVPEDIRIYVYPNLRTLRTSTSKAIITRYGDDLFYYTKDNEIHLMSKMQYDEKRMGGPYSMYIKTALIQSLIEQYNDKIPFIPCKGIASAVSGKAEWLKDNDNYYESDDADKFALTMLKLIDSHGYNLIIKYIRNADVHVFTRYIPGMVIGGVRKLIFESELSYFELQRLLPSEFGIPDKRKYPLNDEKHVRAAIRMFNNCDPSDEKELAEAIIKKMKRYGIEDVKVSASNRFSNYYHQKKKSIKEVAISSKIKDDEFKSLKYMQLSSFKSDNLSDKYPHKEFSKELKHVRFGPKCFGEIFTTKKDNKLVAYYMTEEKDDGNVWIAALEIDKEFQGHGLSRQLILRILDYQNATHLSVNKNNEVAIKLYNKTFEVYDETEKMLFMRLKGKFNESFIGSDYSDILKICSHLSNDDLNKITFYDTYRDSNFVIKRIIHTHSGEPAGFLDVYQFPSNPDIAQIVIAVDDRFRGLGIAKDMINKLLDSDLQYIHNFSKYYWTAHKDNIGSQMLALKNGFIKLDILDKHNRFIFIKHVNSNPDIMDYNDIPSMMKPMNNMEDFVVTESALISDSISIFKEADDPKYSIKMKKFLYSERIKNNKGVLKMYDKIRETNPDIKRMYMKIKMYKRQNLFIDLSYYHGLFLENNVYRMDRAVNFYFEFLNHLLDNKDIDAEYKKKTIFIPVDSSIWKIQPSSELYDFRKNLNPISTIFRLVRTNPSGLKKMWGNRDILFVSSRGYFKVNFNTFELKDIPKFKINLKKLASQDKIEDDDEIDDLNDDIYLNTDNIQMKNIDSPKAMANKMIDRFETTTSVKIDTAETLLDKSAELNTTLHLKLNSNPINLGSLEDNKTIAIITVDPDGPNGFNKLSNSPLDIHDINSYCMPNG